MAAITPTSETAGRELAKPYLGDRHEVYRFASIGLGDIWTLPGSVRTAARIREYAFFVDGGGDIGAELQRPTGIFQFGADSGGLPVTLHVWFKG